MAVAAYVAHRPELLSVVRDWNEPLRKAAQAVGNTPESNLAIYQALQPLLIMYGRPKIPEAGMPAWFALYYQSLAGQPLKAIEEAVSVYIATSEIHAIPNPGRLNKLAEPMASALRMAANRCRLAVEYRPTPPRPDPEADAEMARGFKELSAQLGSRKAAQQPPQRLGITPQEAARRIRAAPPPT